MQNKILALLFVLGTSAVANEILSDMQNNILSLSKQKIQEDSSKLKKDWINPIIYTYSYTNNKITADTRTSVLSINQPIFRSGGIYYAIKYATNIKKSSSLSLAIQKKELISKALNIVYSIKKFDIQIEQQKNLLSNANIDLKIKKESVFNGLLDISFLNNSIIAKNKTALTLENLQFNKQNLINSLKTLSDLPYDKINLPKLDILSKDYLEKENLNIKQSKLNIDNSDNLRGITNAKYLPSVNVNYAQSYNHVSEDDSYRYGFNVIVPIDFKGLSDSRSAKISYLKSKQDYELTRLNEAYFIDSKLSSLKNIENKIKLTKQNIISYNKLLNQTKEYFDAGLKTQDDYNVLKNSRDNEKLNIDIYKIDKQIELLELYKRINSDKI